MLTESFNLLEDPWIPCIEQGGQQVRDRSLLELLNAAQELGAIQHASPIVTLVLHRFVVSFLYAALRGPRNVSSLRSILEPGRFDFDAISAYAATVRDNFWLFHPDRPFLQDPRLIEEMKDDSDAPTSIYQLFRETAPPRGKTLFDHVVSHRAGGVTAAEASRYLLADQFFALQDGRGYAPSMLTFGAALYVAGENLFETLALNLLPYNAESPIKSPHLEKDRPVWEGSEFDLAAFPDGWLDYLTRPYRRLLLVSPDSSTVTHIYRKAATHLDKEWRSLTRDPWIAYRVTDKGVAPVRFTANQALWRDSQVLVQHLVGRETGAPGYSNLLTRLGRGTELSACGVVAGNNDIDLWRHERLPLPRSYLTEPDLTVELGRGIQLAEDASRTLRTGVWRLAQGALFPAGNPERKRVKSLVDSLAAERPYWAALDTPFRKLMVDLASAWPRHEQDMPLGVWATAIRDAAINAFEAAARSLETSGRGLRAAAEARGSFGAQLHRVLETSLTARQV
jgi:CRISPR system Cascade subunit CasA